jgi:hypothetical protein
MRIGNARASIRGTLRNEFSFAKIKDIVGAAGLSVHEISYIQQKLRGGASKGQLMDQIDGLAARLGQDDQDRFVIACIEEMTQRNKQTIDALKMVLNRVGWGISDAGVYPFRLQVDIETRDLEDFARDGLAKCIRRCRDGDFDGAITSICGVIDQLTEIINDTKSLRDHKGDSYQQRVVRSLSTLETEFRRPLDQTAISPGEISRIWKNHFGVVNQSAYVLGAFRREYADVHGVKYAPPELVQRALDCAVFLVRTFSGLMYSSLPDQWGQV